MPDKPITQRANGNITPKKGPGDGLKPGEKRTYEGWKPLSEQGGIDPGSIRKMTPADTNSFSKPGYRVDLSRSMISTKGGRPYGQAEYIKLAPGSKKVTAVSTKPTTTTTTKATTPAPAKKEEAPKEKTAMRMQTIIDEKGKKTYKNVVYSKYQPGKGWVLTGTPLVVDKRKKQ